MSPARLLAVCRQRGVERVAVTDHDAIQGAFEAAALDPRRVIVGEEIRTTEGELLGYFMQEFVPPGLSPEETIARLRALPNVAFLQGNTDRYLVTGQRPQIVIHSEEDWDNLRGWIAERDANFRWTLDHLTYADYAFLRELPPRLRIEVPGYGAVAAVHATAHDDETFMPPDTPDEQLAAAFDTIDARLILCGHTHRPMDRTVNGVRIVNDGSVGMPLDGDPRPTYVQLDFDGPDCQVTIHRVDYDRQAVIAELERVQHPARSWVIQRLKTAR